MQGNSGLVIRFVPGEFTFFKEISKANRRFGQALVSSVFKCALRPMVLSVALVYLVAEVNEWREKGYSVTEQRGTFFWSCCTVLETREEVRRFRSDGLAA